MRHRCSASSVTAFLKLTMSQNTRINQYGNEQEHVHEQHSMNMYKNGIHVTCSLRRPTPNHYFRFYATSVSFLHLN